MLYKMCPSKNPLCLTEFKIVLFSLFDYSNKQIADKLCTSEKNIEKLLHIICQKLGVRKKPGMIGECFRLKILNEMNC